VANDTVVVAAKPGLCGGWCGWPAVAAGDRTASLPCIACKRRKLQPHHRAHRTLLPIICLQSPCRRICGWDRFSVVVTERSRPSAASRWQPVSGGESPCSDCRCRDAHRRFDMTPTGLPYWSRNVITAEYVWGCISATELSPADEPSRTALGAVGQATCDAF
jgi:hypothetical protein